MHHDNGDRSRRLLRGRYLSIGSCNDDSNLQPHQVGSEFRVSLIPSTAESPLDVDVPTLRVSEVGQPLTKAVQRRLLRREIRQHANRGNFPRRLRINRGRRGE